jgi:oxygen-independent coproporphyrinogen-3 oxidase
MSTDSDTLEKEEKRQETDFNPNLSNQYLDRLNLITHPREDADSIADDLDDSYEGLADRIENCMAMTMEAFPCFDFQYPSAALARTPKFEKPYELLWSNYNMHENNTALYVHIPYCRSKCSFCYFTVAANRADDEIDTYLDALETEIQAISPHVQDRIIESVYIGGGTPTYLSARQLERLFKMLYKYYNLAHVKEWSIESTPTLATPDKLKVMKEYGVNRFSMGIQTTHDHILKKLNRSFERKDIDNVIAQTRKIGIDNINLDFMYALPGQSMQHWLDTLNDTIDQDIPGITIYSLDLHESTQFFRKKDELEMPDLKTQLRMYDNAVEMFNEKGYQKINNSIFAKDKSYYIHQNRRWENLPLIAVGAGAQAYSPGFAYRNIPTLKLYLDAIKEGKSVLHKFTPVVAGQEFYREGVSMIRYAQLEKAGFEKRYGSPFKDRFEFLINTLIELDYMEETSEEIRLTKRGLHRSNMISMFFYCDDIKKKLVDHLYVAHAPQMQALRSVGLTEQRNLR